MVRVASRPGRARTSDVAPLLEEDANITFRELMLSEAVLRGLLEAGFDRPSPIQLMAIPVGKFGTDLVAQAKSGTGKTCVFSVIVLEGLNLARRVPQALIVAPTREIAVQICSVVNAIGEFCEGLRVGSFIGGLDIVRDRKRLQHCHVIVGTPGRLCALVAEGSLAVATVRTLVLDEADKLLEETFMGDLEYIVQALPARKQVLAFSATYTAEQKACLSGWMRDPTLCLLDADRVSLQGVTQYYEEVGMPPGIEKQDRHAARTALLCVKAQALLRILDQTPFHQCVVFMNGCAEAHDLVATLVHHGTKLTFLSLKLTCLRLKLTFFGRIPRGLHRRRPETGTHTPPLLVLYAVLHIRREGWCACSTKQEQRNSVMASLRALRLRVLVSSDLTARCGKLTFLSSELTFLSFRGCPFNTGCLPLSYSGISGLNVDSHWETPASGGWTWSGSTSS
jgi:superfamily II DNA/RNA helicase